VRIRGRGIAARKLDSQIGLQGGSPPRQKYKITLLINGSADAPRFNFSRSTVGCEGTDIHGAPAVRGLYTRVRQLNPALQYAKIAAAARGTPERRSGGKSGNQSAGDCRRSGSRSVDRRIEHSNQRTTGHGEFPAPQSGGGRYLTSVCTSKASRPRPGNPVRCRSNVDLTST